jgi:hypothetical protein
MKHRARVDGKGLGLLDTAQRFCIALSRTVEK